MTESLSTSFYRLSPELILRALESVGFFCTGRCLQLNSLENRVHEIQLETTLDDSFGEKVVSKFYRPHRWSLQQIQEEHDFLYALQAEEVPVVCPIEREGRSLFTCAETGIHFCVFPKFGGRNLDEFNNDQARSLGRILARIHMVGARHVESERPYLDIGSFGEGKLDYLVDQEVLPEDIRDSFLEASERFFDLADPFFADVDFLRLHGDAHVGNILNRDDSFYFVDFDDMLIGPAIQDLWLLAPGRDTFSRSTLKNVLEGYQELRDFNHRELFLIEALRTMRVIHFITWIHQRWEDHSFQRVFDQFDTNTYWREQLQFIYEQVSTFEEIVSRGDPMSVID